ncbi:unnamed protein product [Leptidea sinapis]|uniref:Ubiquitin-like domain-containing protein n=1 Tax=Leptidea sinapis TaxID=189913 RepID=A0A5E4R7R1_9NEOP|nr:unnamed protein product [Leptidea sinapis]
MQVVRLRFDGQPINENDTPTSLEMEEGDTIEVYQQQTGGRVVSLSSDRATGTSCQRDLLGVHRSALGSRSRLTRPVQEWSCSEVTTGRADSVRGPWFTSHLHGAPHSQTNHFIQFNFY